MPELPEVEFQARRLREWLVGQQILEVHAIDGTPLRDLTAAALVHGLEGRRVSAVRRHGKQLFIDLDDTQTLLTHLGMTGKFVRRQTEVRRGTRMSFRLPKGWLDFVDPRRFGRVRLLKTTAVAEHPEVKKMGPDALNLCAKPGGLENRLQRTSRAIKVALMDQARLAGVGNIYAAEALYIARLDPWAPANSLTTAQFSTLAKALHTAMTESLERETDDEIIYLQSDKSNNPFQIYGREGEPCPQTGQPIVRTAQQGRSTFWVPAWQRAGHRY